MGSKRIIVWLSITAAVLPLSAIPLFDFREDAADGISPAHNLHTSSGPNFPLTQLPRLRGKSPVFVETVCHARPGTIIPSAASPTFQILPGYNMLLLLGILEPQSDNSLKLQHALRIDVIGWDFPLPLTPIPMPLAFPDDPRYELFALMTLQACLYPEHDILSNKPDALQLRSLPAPWVLATYQTPHQVLLKASPWAILTFSRGQLSIVIGLHPDPRLPDAQGAHQENLNQLRQAVTHDWRALQTAFLLPSSGSAPAIAAGVPAVMAPSDVFSLLAHKHEWRLPQDEPASVADRVGAPPTIPENRFFIQRTLDPERVKQFKTIVKKAEEKYSRLAHDPRGCNLSKELDDIINDLHIIWKAHFPGIPFYLNRTNFSSLESHAPETSPSLSFTPPAKAITVVPPPPPPPSPPPPPPPFPPVEYTSRISRLRPITTDERIAYAKEKGISIPPGATSQEIQRLVRNCEDLDNWVIERRRSAATAPHSEAAPTDPDALTIKNINDAMGKIREMHVKSDSDSISISSSSSSSSSSNEW
jgi:hypothetical protein